ncbi:MAG: lysophospholipid acyltransferase family protein [Bacteroidota bacterium]|nr:lysophospholipid acyltransferase family protein [Bacteroidota bacterium]MDP4190023.1 lysophospholipid acyltransferase family protein [Bacteroidota bacterium]
MSIRKFRQNLLRALGNIFLFNVVSLLCRTLRITVRNQHCIEKLLNEKKSFILAFWHGSMLVPWYVHRNKSLGALISKSKDGELLFRILNKWNYKVIRGSSHIGGSIALGIMVDYARNNTVIAITPDGPRGPERKLKPGAVIAAKRANVPLVLLGVGYRKKKTLKSWDKFEIPMFFSNVNLVYSEPIYINKTNSFEEVTALIEKCEIKLNELQQEASNF